MVSADELERFRAELAARKNGVTDSDIKHVNESTEAKNAGIKLIRTEEEERYRKSIRHKNLGLFFLALIVICFIALTYLAYTGKLNIANVILPDFKCSNVNVPACPQIPACPAAPDCSLKCSSVNVTCPPVQVNIPAQIP